MKIIAMCMIIAGIMGSCIGPNPDVPDVDKDKSMSAVVVGMQKSDLAGSCPGAELDAHNMAKLLKAYSDNVELFISEDATKSKVVAAFKKALNESEYVVFYYSGHGGSEVISRYSEEDDGKDEMIFLYDKILLDDEIWSMISASNTKVFLIFDCCHSETMYRHAGLTLKKGIRKLMSSKSKPGFSMLCWSGCEDDKVSYGGNDGGVLTNTLLKKFNKNDTYESLWSKITSDVKLLMQEVPQVTEIDFDTSKQIFR